MFKRYMFVDGYIPVLNGTGMWSIDVNGSVTNEGVVVLPFPGPDGHLCVNLQSWDGLRDYKVIDLVAIHFKSLRIDPTLFNRVQAFVIDKDKTNTHASNVGYRFTDSPLEVPHAPGFYYVPAFTGVAINRNGDVINSRKGVKRNWTVCKPNEKINSKGGYRLLSVAFATIGNTSLQRHRALCLTFRDYPDNVDSIQVNHIHGIPGEDDLSGLEWVTRSGNMQHAHDTGLNQTNVPVLARNVVTGELLSFKNLTECDTFAGLHMGSTRRRIKDGPFGKVYSDGFQFKLADDDRDWVIPDNPEQEVKDSQTLRRIIVRDCRDRTTLTCASVTDASEITRILPVTIRARLHRQDLSAFRGFQFKDADDETPWPDFTQEEAFAEKAFQYSVDARNLFTGETRNFDSRRKAEIVFRDRSISGYLSAGRNYLRDDGWQFKTSGTDWEHISDPEEAIYLKQRDVCARRTSDGAITIAAGGKALARLLKVPYDGLRKAALSRGHVIHEGYQFRLGVSNEPWPTVSP